MRTTSSPETAPGAPASDGDILHRLAVDAVERLRLGAAAVVLDAADAPLHTAGAPELQQVLLGIILHHRAALRQGTAGAARIIGSPPVAQAPAFPDASLAIVPLALPDGQPLGTLLALHVHAWSAATPPRWRAWRTPPSPSCG